MGTLDEDSCTMQWAGCVECVCLLAWFRTGVRPDDVDAVGECAAEENVVVDVEKRR